MPHPSRRMTGVMAMLAATSITAMSTANGAPAGPDDSARERAAEVRLDEPLTGQAADIDDGLVGARGDVRVSIRLAEPSLAQGGDAAAIADQQAEVIAAVEAAGGSVDGTADTVLNVVFATIDGDEVDGLVDTGVISTVNEVADYELDLSETVPYIGATEVQDSGNSGAGVKVAVLDSGVDYTHEALGGEGTLAAYEAAHGVNCELGADGTLTCDDPNFTTRDGLFPTDKVVEGVDFVGEDWPVGPRTTDDDPIDYDGHGTHVADIIAGELGVAPDASIVAVKVCSAVASSCNGVSLILGMEYAVQTAQVDIINMSLGSVYGQAFDDDLSAAVDAATAAGVLTVASAGNSANKPYVTGSPAAAPTALSVAQTQTPSARLPFLNVVDGSGETSAVIRAVFQEWSMEPDAVVSGPLVYGDGAGNNLDGCVPFAESFVDDDPGTIDEPPVVLVDRGACSFTTKIANVANAGGIVGIIGLVAPGDPFSGAYDAAGCDPDGDGELNCDDIPGYMISQEDSNALKNALQGDAVSIVIDPAEGEDLVGTLVGSSSRGPTINFNNLIKPEIGAPGASISAEAGTGTETTPFGGTSGAAPMVAGSAALVLADDPGLVPQQIKSLLVNTAETDIDTEPGAGLAPITRIGGGEVRVDRAVASSASAWETEAVDPTLSFGFIDVPGTWSDTKTVTVENYGDEEIDYTISPTFRFEDDAANGAVTPSLSTQSLTVPAGGSATFDITLQIEGAALRDWTANSGALGADPSWLDLLEYDGYVRLDAVGDADDIHLPWHVLPRKAADIDVTQDRKNYTLTNVGADVAPLEIYNLIATSEDLAEGPRGGLAPTPDFRAAGVAFYDVPATFCESKLLVGFAVNSWERTVHANAPALYEFDIDTDMDGEPDYAVFNADLSLLGGSFGFSDGRNAVYAQNLDTGTQSVFFFVDHDTNSANTVLLACGEQIGLDAKSIKKRQVGVAFAQDVYFGGPGDTVEVAFGAGKTKPPLRVGNTPVQFLDVAPGDATQVRLFANNSSTDGALVMVRDGAPEGEEAFILSKDQ